MLCAGPTPLRAGLRVAMGTAQLPGRPPPVGPTRGGGAWGGAALAPSGLGSGAHCLCPPGWARVVAGRDGILFLGRCTLLTARLTFP